MDGSNGNTLQDMCLRGPIPPEVPQHLQLCLAIHAVWLAIRDRNTRAQCKDKACLITIQCKLNSIMTNYDYHLDVLNNKIHSLLYKLDVA
jgi:hypothetical protein